MFVRLGVALLLVALVCFVLALLGLGGLFWTLAVILAVIGVVLLIVGVVTDRSGRTRL